MNSKWMKGLVALLVTAAIGCFSACDLLNKILDIAPSSSLEESAVSESLSTSEENSSSVAGKPVQPEENTSEGNSADNGENTPENSEETPEGETPDGGENEGGEAPDGGKEEPEPMPEQPPVEEEKPSSPSDGKIELPEDTFD